MTKTVDRAIYRHILNKDYSKRNMVDGRDPMPEMTITSSYFDSRVGSNTFTMGYGTHDTVDIRRMPESTLSPSQRLRIWPHSWSCFSTDVYPTSRTKVAASPALMQMQYFLFLSPLGFSLRHVFFPYYKSSWTQ